MSDDDAKIHDLTGIDPYFFIGYVGESLVWNGSITRDVWLRGLEHARAARTDHGTSYDAI